MSNSIMRNVKCMGRIGIRVLGMGLLCVLIIVGFGILGGNSFNSVKSELNFVTGYVNLFVILVFGITIVTAYMPIIFSFGSSRKDYFIGKHIVNIIIIFIMLILDIAAYTASNAMKYENIMYLLAMMMCLVGAASLLGILIWKYGMKGYICFCIFCGFIGGFIGGFSSDLAKSAFVKKTLNFSYIGILALVAGIIVYAVSSGFEWKMIRKYEVK